MKKVIITGVTGQDGSFMTDYLLENTEHTIIAGVRRLSVKNHENISHLKDNPRFTIRNKGEVVKYIPTIIIDTNLKIPLKIILLKEGLLAWEGTNKEIFKTDNEAIVDFVYSSNLFKKIKY